MSTATLSHTWRRRLHRARRATQRTARAVVAGGAVLGFAAAIKVFAVPAHPDGADIAATAHRIANQRDAAGQFAADFVAAVLSTPATNSAVLHWFITPPGPAAPAAPTASTAAPAVISPPRVWSVVPAGSAGPVSLYSVTVVVAQRPYATAPPARAFYRVPVSIWQFAPRAMDWPAPVSDPGPGADVTTGYDHPLDVGSPVYAVVAGFLTTYLTATGGLDRYVVADSWITPVGGYQSAVITAAAADTAVPAAPAPGTRVRVRATVTAQTAQYATLTFAFPLTVENSGGTWMIADIDAIPHLADTDPVSAPAHR